MTVRVHWSCAPKLLSNSAVAAAATAALDHGKRTDVELSVVLVDDATLARLHAEWFGDPAPTDVIAFDLGDEGPGPAGEVYASVDCARRVAARRGLDAARELALYVVHGTLHLCGYDDREPAARRRMRRAERAVLARWEAPADGAPQRRAPARAQRRRGASH